MAKSGTATEMAAATATKRQKTVYLIRHAESEENRKIASLGRTFKTLSKFSLPKSSDVYDSTGLLNVQEQVNSKVSEVGAKQIAYMKEMLLHDEFVRTSGIQLVVHSPLLRARQTSEGMLGCLTAATASDSDLKAETVKRVVETDLLLEKTLAEWTPMSYNRFIKRIENFEKWLWEQEEDTVALVGHSQFFKAMLGLDFKFGNCEVWKVTFDLSKSNTTPTVAVNEKEDAGGFAWKLSPQWMNLEKKYSCEVQN